MSEADQLASLLAQIPKLFADFEAWADGQVMILAGRADEGFDATGGKTGALGFYPIINVNGQTIYAPCLARLHAIALGSGNADTLLGLIQSVTARLQAIDTAVARANTDVAGAILSLGQAATTKFAEVDVFVATADADIDVAVGRAGTAATEAHNQGTYAKEQGDAAKAQALAIGDISKARSDTLAYRDQAAQSAAEVPAVKATLDKVAVSLAPDALFSGSDRLYPVVIDAANGKVIAVDQASGELGGSGIDLLNRRLLGGAAATMLVGNAVGPLYPLIIDAAGNTFLGVNTQTGAPYGSMIDKLLGTATGQLASDGRTLNKYRAKQSALKATGTGTLRVGIAGDSWAEQVRIPQALSTLLTAAYGKASDGWQSVNGNGINGVTTGQGGWTFYDVTENYPTAPLRGVGVDGFAAETTNTTAVFNIGNLVAEQIRIFFWDGTGSWRYRVDGGAWTTVTGGNTQAATSILVSGLSNAAHTLNIDTAPNTGTVTLHGFLADRPSQSGVQLNKIGNGGAEGQHYSMIQQQIAAYSSVLALDALVIILGTNDYRNVRGIATYTAGLQALIAAHRSANPNLSIILVAPAQCNVTAVPTLADYRSALVSVARSSGCEFYSMFDQWASYAIESSLGQWSDALHISDAAAFRPARGLMQFSLLGA